MNTLEMMFRNIIHAFFGSPRRTQMTIAGCFVIYCITHPVFFQNLINAIVVLGVAIFGLGLIIRHGWGGKKTSGR